MAEPPPEGPLRRIAATPGRSRDVVVRLLRQPRTTAELVAGTDGRIAAVHAEVAELRATLVALTDDLRQSLDRQDEIIEQLGRAEEDRRLAGVTLAALLHHTAAPPPDESIDDGPVVSIVLPVRDRPDDLRRAVRSVLAQTYPRWQLVVVDDGSQVPIEEAVGDLIEGDDRIVVERTSGVGAAAARNAGVERATGELVTFLDSDNWWLPRRLEGVVRSFSPEVQWATDQQLVLAQRPAQPHVRDIDRPIAELAEGNFIDLGCVTVRRSVLGDLRAHEGEPGAFDPQLVRLSDWDMIERLARSGPPEAIPLVGQVYSDAAPDRISTKEAYGPSFHRVRRRIIGRPAEGLRILFAEWHFPQVTETYIHSDLVGLQALGAEVEVWSEEDVAVPYEPGVPWRRGSLEDHIRDFRPDLVLSHWLHVGRDYRPITRQMGIPHAVRCHGFDYDAGVMAGLAADPGIVVHLFPHLMGDVGHLPNVVVDPVAFDPDRISPTTDKDRRMVLRLAAGLLTKDLETFLLTAKRCPEHHFVLGMGHTYKAEERTEILLERAAELESPAEVVVDLGYEKAAAVTMEAGLYLHTHGTDHPLGMPISAVEAMASGSVVLVRDLPGSDYTRGGALTYRGATPEERADHAAALINDTLSWDDERWAAQGNAGLDVAWTRHPADLVAERMLRTWRERLGVGR